MLATIASIALLGQQAGPTMHAGDGRPLFDSTRPVSMISRTSFTLQYATTTACETRLKVRQGDIPAFAYNPSIPISDPRRTAGSKDYGSGTDSTTWHTISVTGLMPGKRYYYRVYDPGAMPTGDERKWGAIPPYRREYAVSTEAPAGRKTIIHIPVKVLLMPNVVNTESAYLEDGTMAPDPERVTPAQLKLVEDEFAVSSRFFWINSGMRLWVDYRFFVDDRWEAWGPERESPAAFYKAWPMCRSYGGKDYVDPGGGDFTILDTKNVEKVNHDPIYEARPYSGQIEVAWPRRYNHAKKQWEFYSSGGGTLGVDDFPNGYPGRSQFFAGYDTAWLATHEFHHDMESHGQFSLAYREDDRIVFDHFHPRMRRIVGGGKVEEEAWTTNGRHGEHWDGIAYWDRTITDCQWLRIALGYTDTVADADEDGVPDNDPRLPLDEKRFGSSPKAPQTDGQMGDLAKVMLSTWVPGPIQSSWTKPPLQSPIPNPRLADNNGDGSPDWAEPYPLEKFRPAILPMTATIDGDPREWAAMPTSGHMSKGGIELTFKQAHDEFAYYGLVQIKGNWQRVNVLLDGEGDGPYSGVGIENLEIVNTKPTGPSAGPVPDVAIVRPAEFKAPGLKYRATRSADGTTTVEFGIPNGGPSAWFWQGGGRQIGASINVFDPDGRGYSVWEPYHLFFCTMIESHGEVGLPSGAPPEVSPNEQGVVEYKPDDKRLKLQPGWKLDGGVLRHEGDESAVFIDGLKAKEFDLVADIEVQSDAILAGFLPQTAKMTRDDDYVGLVGTDGDSRSVLRVFGQESGETRVKLTPGDHRIQLTRREGEVWLLLDGKPTAYAVDRNPNAVLNRLAVLGPGGEVETVRAIWLRD